MANIQADQPTSKLTNHLTNKLTNNLERSVTMAVKTYSVPAMHCNHCVMTIEREVGQFVEGVKSVKADLDTKAVTVEVESEAVFPAVESMLREIGYPPAVQ